MRPDAGAHKPLYSSKIIKAGAILADIRILLTHWDVTVSVQKNLECLRQDNVFGKAFRSRVEDVRAIFRQRYLAEVAVTKALVVLVTDGFSAALDRILYFYAVKADRLLYDIMIELLHPLKAQGLADVDVIAIEKTQKFPKDIGKSVCCGTICATTPRTKNDVYAALVERGLQLLVRGGMLGAIASRTWFFLSSFQKWREEILLQEASPTVFADLSYGVLDTAMVETAAYCLEAVGEGTS